MCSLRDLLVLTVVSSLFGLNKEVTDLEIIFVSFQNFIANVVLKDIRLCVSNL